MDTIKNFDTSLSGRLRNTNLPKNHALMPLFEAAVNSIHAIEEGDIDSLEGQITIEIIRSPQTSIEDEKKNQNDLLPEIIGFKVIDNGVGFNDANLTSFMTFDSEHKIDKGCRGIGRLMWLKAFEKVEVQSIYTDENGDNKVRDFTFDKIYGVRDVSAQIYDIKKRQTIVFLSGFVDKYKKNAAKTAESISDGLFEHCLWYFIRDGGAPNISIKDSDGTIISLDNVYEEHIAKDSIVESLPIKEKKFDLTHIRLRNFPSKTHRISFCAGNRLVKEESINNKIPGLFGKIKDERGEFKYNCYVSSTFLDEKVRGERTGFNIEEAEIEDGVFSDSELSMEEIRNAVIGAAKKQLNELLEENKKAGKEKIDRFVDEKAPRYKPILSRVDPEKLIVDPSISDKDLETVLHKQLYEIENELISEGHEIMKPQNFENLEDYEERVKKYLSKASDIKKSDLANYVSHRKVVLDLLSMAINMQKNGNYSKEDLIHNLILPMGKDSTELFQDESNLWIIDERLSFHNYLGSDKTLSSMPITESKSTKEPDIISLNVFDNPLLVSEGKNLPLASINVVEIKRPMRNDMAEGEDKNPIEQALGYLDRARKGEIKTSQGRPIPESMDVPGFCYIICDLTPKMIERAKLAVLRPTYDKMGYFGYNENYKAYIEVISFDKLLSAAKERNRAFFDKLGLPTN